MAKTSYAEKLKDPRWQKKRLEILQRDEFTCRYCGTNEITLHVHHFAYASDPWEVDDTDLITACEDCHFLIESNKDSYVSDILRKKIEDGWHFLVAYVSEGDSLVSIYRKEGGQWRFCGTIGPSSFRFIKRNMEGS